MIIRNVTPSDYCFLLQAVDRWWTDHDTRDLMHPLFVREFSPTGFVAEEGGTIIGFLLGCLSQTSDDEAYVHMVASDPCCRQQGVASALYGAFAARVQQKGCRRLVVTISPHNHEAICFHTRLGFECRREEADSEIEGLPAIKDYAGPGQHKVVMIRDLSDR